MERSGNVLESLIYFLTSPIAKKRGVTISPEECEIWVDTLEKYGDHVVKELKKYYELKAKTRNMKLAEPSEKDEHIRAFIANELVCLRASEGCQEDCHTERYDNLTKAIEWLDI